MDVIQLYHGIILSFPIVPTTTHNQADERRKGAGQRESDLTPFVGGGAGGIHVSGDAGASCM